MKTRLSSFFIAKMVKSKSPKFTIKRKKMDLNQNKKAYEV
jgi:hypothetical protein